MYNVQPSPSTTGTAVERPSAPPHTHVTTRAEDLSYGAVFGGAVGGSVIAILFLVLDVVRGEPFLTPSRMGAALLTATEPAAVDSVRVDMVAFYTFVHFVAFILIAGVASRLYLATRRLQGRIPVFAAVIFALLTGSLLAGDVLLMSGLVSALGVVPVLVANAITAWLMAVFLGKALAHRLT